MVKNLSNFVQVNSLEIGFVDCSFIYTNLRRLFVLTMFEFLRHEFGAAEKSQGTAEKNKEKVEAISTGFYAEFFGSHSVETFCFARKTKIQMLTTSCWSLIRIPQRFLKSLGL